MKKIDVVIGAGYGDEGKGLMTDYLTGQQEKPSDTVVVRFNGGAQAGHTVQNDKCRHVFKHYSSGTLHGATTCLSRFFVVNPLLWAEEYEALYRKSVWQRSLKGQRLLIDARAHVSTPYDMLYNQIIELSRGAARHGSCGVGFGATLERAKLAPVSILRAGQLASTENQLRERVKYIRKIVIREAAKLHEAHKLPEEATKLFKLMHSDELLQHFINEVDRMLQNSDIRSNALKTDRLKDSKLIFEGAQGLKLDMEHGTFPHVTRSNTNLKNVCMMLNDAKYDYELNVHYMTRAYRTRHGAGELPFECKSTDIGTIVDHTNIVNVYQGALRFAPLYVNELFGDIQDCNQSATASKIITNIGVTCLDQVNESFPILLNGKVRFINKDQLLTLLKAPCSGKLYTSYGPTAKDIKAHG